MYNSLIKREYLDKVLFFVYMTFTGGMNAYHTHKEPNQEMLEIWEEKERLISEILKTKDILRHELDFNTIDELKLILNKK